MKRGLATFAAAAVLITACSRTPSPEIALIGSPKPSAIELRGLPSSDLSALSRANLTPDQWHPILAVRI
ncbi:MAG TPA: hypothetical protein VFS23_22510, partial [Vicinamibacterales bacterium]|nr:hypothetical protein [Vicinamibacterales bacterium]